MLFLDTESIGTEDLSTVGAYKYWENARVTLVGYAIDGGPVQIWDRALHPYVPPTDLIEAFNSNMPIVAHNAQFDRLAMSSIPASEFWTAPPERWGCTMSLAYSLGLPGSLDSLARLVGLRKGDEDGRLKKMFTREPFADPREYPIEWSEFIEYCRTDVEVCRALWLKLPHWNFEPKMYALDQRMNDRGVAIDIALAETLAEYSRQVKDDLDRQVCELTNGRVEKCTQRQRIQDELNARGAEVDNTQAATLANLLDHPAAGELAQLALVANKSSTAKYDAALRMVSSDGRLRGTLVYCGASRTRRWSGRGFQTQNLPSRGLPSDEELDEFITWARYGGVAGAAAYAGEDGLRYASGAVRRVIRAEQGRRLYVSDLSNIEGRILAWLAAEDWKVKAFRDFDAGTGPDVYRLTAQTIINKTPDAMSKTERNIYGKVPDLACGYESGVKGILKYMRDYKVEVAEHYDTVQAAVPPNVWNDTLGQFESYGGEQARKLGVGMKTWVTCRAIVETWRLRHPKVKQLWADAQAMVVQARVQGKAERGKLAARQEGKWTVVELPSGRVIPYLDLQIEDDGITYRGAYARTGLYGGKIVENIVQSLARDVLADGLYAARNDGPLFTVHDEIIVESSEPVALDEMMTRPVAWAPDLPLAAEMTVRERYGK